MTTWSGFILWEQRSHSNGCSPWPKTKPKPKPKPNLVQDHISLLLLQYGKVLPYLLDFHLDPFDPFEYCRPAVLYSAIDFVFLIFLHFNIQVIYFRQDYQKNNIVLIASCQVVNYINLSHYLGQFFFFWLCLSIRKFPGQGSNPLHGSDPSHSSDNAISLTC